MDTTFASPSPLQSPLIKTLPVAIAAHALVLFGVTFVPEYMPKVRSAPTLDITLVQTHSEQAPDQVKFLAQANQEASGQSDQENRPKSPLAALQVEPTEGTAPLQSTASAPDVFPKLQPQILTTKGETYEHVDKSPELQEEELEKPIDEERADQTAEIAQLLAEMDEEEARYARRPRVHFIDAVSAKSAVEAQYIDEWVQKIERIGNINFPEEAIRRNLSGKLILNTTLDHSGHVVSVHVDVSSGFDVLDKAAMRIVELAAPYPPLPQPIREKWDQLNITRTWLFKSGTINTE
ncbi:MAG: TonB family protein [Thiofilum sp.]|uniref:energy transducer TonB n=1 Tax=Thiofilum sp. TaxID=2212733 RepID=UPI0025CC0677|nr:TonB family protein [Thiofilum sp.]MBK8452777.1 TonB family protein [Thiofilum sp.]